VGIALTVSNTLEVQINRCLKHVTFTKPTAK